MELETHMKMKMKVGEEKPPPSAVNGRLWGMGGKGTQTSWLGFALLTPFYEVYTPVVPVSKVPSTLLFPATALLSA